MDSSTPCLEILPVEDALGTEGFNIRREQTKAIGFWEGMAAKTTSWWRSIPLRARAVPLSVTEEEWRWLYGKLKEKPRSPDGGLPSLKESSRLLVRRIREETERLNRNNVTRTAAYLEMYGRHPELHWALLAHLVSRNGGWSMTDLRGEWLPKLLDQETIRLTFRMLEACNALIFRDAYPQLLLYSESKRQGHAIFELLPHLSVSVFMRPFWELFWRGRNPVPLTVALVVNEQNVIEKRVVRDPLYRDEILSTLAFRSQPLLQSNQLLLPLLGKRGVRRLAGRVLERFGQLDERIEFGKDLYSILFGYPKVHARALAFAEAVPHTGSRADYWPHLFTDKPKSDAVPGISGFDTALGPPPWFSPRLTDAWDNQALGPVQAGDWYEDLSALDYLKRMRQPRVIDMTREHVFGQRKLQAAVRIGDYLDLGGS
ncbi:DUF2515 family protein [Cohnella thailandensis]|uniref:DUF2515 family protein n=1 Tax=Cohnella thailandensis TaxID=557557 RepID=A0A841SVI5_9BACL|nr:DUF2515 family protein [Cohnella thailandensis]MBB6632711.1 DUF2515 family protein [Cohnella thailandensis]MBP1975600.1 hypothetical protein [Cohnella thailandensis]